jgi:hypothetical protein
MLGAYLYTRKVSSLPLSLMLWDWEILTMQSAMGLE